MAISNTPSPLSNIVAAKTYNAAWFSGSTKELQITNAIAAAVADGALYVYVPANMLPYNASQVTFNTTIKMICEGGNSSLCDVMAYGVAGNGVATDLSAINSAISYALAAKTSLSFPAGTFLVDPIGSALNFTNIREIKGIPGATIIKFASTATGDANGRLCVFDNTNAYWNTLLRASIQKVSGIAFDFSSVAGINKYGITLGAYANSLVAGGTAFRLVMEDCEIYRLNTTGSYGLHIKDVVQCNLVRTVVWQNYNNVLIQGTLASSLPTTVVVSHCNFKEAVKNALVVKNVYGLTIDQETVIEYNGEQAITIQPGVGEFVESVNLHDIWLENNWAIYLADPATRATKYEILIDGTSSVVYDVGISRCRLSSIAKILDANLVIDLVIDAPDRPGALTGDFNIRGAGSVVHLVNWPAVLAAGPGPGVTVTTIASALVFFEGALYMSLALDFGNLVNGSQGSLGFAFTGVTMGSNVSCAASVSLQGQQMTASCNGVDTVTVVLQNNTGGPINLGTFTAWIRAFR